MSHPYDPSANAAPYAQPNPYVQPAQYAQQPAPAHYAAAPIFMAPAAPPPPSADEQMRRYGRLAIVPVVLVLLLAIGHLISVAGRPATSAEVSNARMRIESAGGVVPAPATSQAPTTTRHHTTDKRALRDQAMRIAQAQYNASDIRIQLQKLIANLPPGASVRSLGMMPKPQLTATVVEGNHARTYTSESSEGFPRALTHRLRAAAPLDLSQVNPAAPAEMIGLMTALSDRDVDGFSSLELTAGHSGKSHWTSVWTGAMPAKFRADRDGGHLKLVSGRRR